MRASACASPGKAEGGTGKPPPKKKQKKQNKTTEGGLGGSAKTTHSHQTARQHHQRRPNLPQKAPKTGPPNRHRGTTQQKPATPSQKQRPTRKEDTKTSRHTPRKKKEAKKKKEPATQPERKGMGDKDHKARARDTEHKKKSQAQKIHPDNPAKKGWAQLRPGPSTHAHTARQNRKRRGAGGAPTQPHTSHKQAETEPQSRTPQTTDTRGTTPQTVPKHTHPRPQPGLAGLTKPTSNREPDPNANAAQQ